MVIPIVKGLPIITAESIQKLKDVFTQDRETAEQLLNTLYIHTHDLIQKVLIEEICRVRGFDLVVPEDEPPKEYA